MHTDTQTNKGKHNQKQTEKHNFIKQAHTHTHTQIHIPSHQNSKAKNTFTKKHTRTQPYKKTPESKNSDNLTIVYK